jgi:predicted nucleic acid-binding protein
MWVDDEPEKQHLASQLVSSSVEKGHCISAQVAQEFFSVAYRKFASQMDDLTAAEYLHLVLSSFRWVPSEPSTVSTALALRSRYKLPWYDSLIVAAALDGDCSILYSEDFQAGRVFEGRLTVVNPFATHKS